MNNKNVSDLLDSGMNSHTETDEEPTPKRKKSSDKSKSPVSVSTENLCMKIEDLKKEIVKMSFDEGTKTRSLKRIKMSIDLGMDSLRQAL